MNENFETVKKPIKRSALRIKLGTVYYGLRRWGMWFKMRDVFARERQGTPLPYTYFTHKTPMLRRLKDVDMWMQYNKITTCASVLKGLTAL